MTPYIDDPDFTLYIGDVRDVLRELPAESVHCVVTSPPYWGLRDYSVDGQLGLEPTPEAYVEAMVGVFREVRRVLRRDGTCWLNLGDSYASSPPGNVAGVGATSGLHGANDASGTYRETLKAGHATKRNTVVGNLKPKDLVGIPWRVAFALQADGWYLRSAIIWSKPNPMPESVTDRPTKAHEDLFLLTREARYFYDADAIREPQTSPDNAGNPASRSGVSRPEYEPHRPDGPLTRERIPMRNREWNPSGRNKRSVWEIATEPYPDAHFATFPQALVEPCVLAGTSERGCCPECGAPWVRETSRDVMNLDTSRPQARRALELAAQHDITREEIEAVISCGVTDAGKAQHTQTGFLKNDEYTQVLANRAKKALGGYMREFLLSRPTTTGWAPSCYCGKPGPPKSSRVTPVPHAPIPSTVLDPFMGSGTTALVARKHGRRSIGVELNPEYAELAAQRLSQLSLLAEGA